MRWFWRFFRRLQNNPFPKPPVIKPGGSPEEQCLHWTNIERVSQLKSDECLDSEAERHAREMWQRGWIGHDGFSSRIRACHRNVASAENVAAGYNTAKGVVDGWMRSAGHRRNILGNYTHMGVGEYGGYWVQIFVNDGVK